MPQTQRSLQSFALGRIFYARPALQVARDCIGKVIAVERDGWFGAGKIVEAEAYAGPGDRAAHSFGGRRTRRTEAMFGPPGHAYVFLLYGLHWNFNLVCAEEGRPEAVLIRALEPLHGVEQMAARRGLARTRALTNGPGKLCQALGIGRHDYGKDLCGTELYLADVGARPRVGRSARIGIDYAGEWADKLWRFYEPGNRHVSGTLAQRSLSTAPPLRKSPQ